MNRMKMLEGLCLVLALMTGCDRGMTISEIEQNERSSRLYANAMEDLQANRMDAAIKGFDQVTQQEPRNYSAHFQLAVLLQDVRKDYVGAISHYRAYMATRPQSDKAPVAQDRVKQCETLYQAEMLRRAGGSATDRVTAENEQLKEEIKRHLNRIAELQSGLAREKAENARLIREAETHRKVLDKLSAAADENGTAKKMSVRQALAELRDLDGETRRRQINPSDAELLDENEDAPGSVVADAKLARQMNEAADREERQEATSAYAQKTDPAKIEAARRSGGTMAGLLGSTNAKKPPTTQRPETYTVQKGDTLSAIALRFYGTRAKQQAIFEYNRATIPVNKRLNVGQVIRLPR